MVKIIVEVVILKSYFQIGSRVGVHRALSATSSPSSVRRAHPGPNAISQRNTPELVAARTLCSAVSQHRMCV